VRLESSLRSRLVIGVVADKFIRHEPQDFLSKGFAIVISATTNLSSWFSERSALTSPLVASRTVSPASCFLTASRSFAPAVVAFCRDAFTTAQLGDAFFTAQSLEHDSHLLFGRKVSMCAAASVDCFRFSQPSLLELKVF
jgi:hypothetical protein